MLRREAASFLKLVTVLQRQRTNRTMSTFSINIHGKPVPVTAAHSSIDISRCLTAKPLTDWAASLDKEISVEQLTIQSVDFFGSRVGFLKFDAHASFNGRKIPSIVFMRGGAVSILVLLRCLDSGERWVVCCRQPRVPVGKKSLLELPAGMLDDSGSFVGVAAKELEEETGIKIGVADLVDLTALAMGFSRDLESGGDSTNEENNKATSKMPGVYPSAGGCDEFLRLLLFRKDLPKSEIDNLRGKATGNIAEGECIVLDLVPYNQLWRQCTDMKALSSMILFEKLRDAGELKDE
jgi:ADP-sugar diphosphatase